ncbi:xanthine dehydrogenase accessory protein PucB [Neiella marina]|uniref:Xanthine dehydrogenase accessory protein PucB n=1 Tax=Neiella marina TaxID=508461 RepID=A0A8J2U9V0_9GAMM|nr:nucleotidyltransferase family protein [Neiella marina]GGA88338.1 xanthine dehydrogenase accessory protein PucB [Neiella marina]
MTLQAAILAAGQSQRFGEANKLLAPLGDSFVLQRSVDTVSSVLPRQQIRLILGHQAAALVARFPTLSHGHNLSYQEGLASSLRCAVKQAEQSLSCQALLVLLADQVLLNTDDLSHLIQVWRQQPNDIICADYGERRGVPAVFPRSVWPQLNELKGDQGGKALLRSSDVVTVAMANAAFDIDTPDDLKRAQDRLLTQE